MAPAWPACCVSAALNAIDRGTLDAYRRRRHAAPFPLSAEEVKQLLIDTADDINFDARADVDAGAAAELRDRPCPLPGVIQTSSRFPSIAGFDQYFGYGRINADTAVRRVRRRAHPARRRRSSRRRGSRISSPRGGDARRASAASPPTRAARSGTPSRSAPGVAAARGRTSSRSSGVGRTHRDARRRVGTLDLAARSPRCCRTASAARRCTTMAACAAIPDRFAFTVRVRVTDDLANVGEDRRTLHLHDDPRTGARLSRAARARRRLGSGDCRSGRDGIEEIILGDVERPRCTPSASTAASCAAGRCTTEPIEVHAELRRLRRRRAVAVPVTARFSAKSRSAISTATAALEVVAADLQGRVYVVAARRRRAARLSGLDAPRVLLRLPLRARSRHGRRAQVPDHAHRHDRDNRLGRALIGGVRARQPRRLGRRLARDRRRRLRPPRLRLGPPTARRCRAGRLLLKDPAKVAAVDPVTNEVTLVAGRRRPRSAPRSSSPPSLGDLDGDGTLEVVAVGQRGVRGTAQRGVRESDSSTLQLGRRARQRQHARLRAARTTESLHGDAGVERGWNPDAFLPGWPVKTALLTTELLPTVGTGSNGPPALADVDGDGMLEIATMSAIGPVYVFDHDGVSFFGRHPERPGPHPGDRTARRRQQLHRHAHLRRARRRGLAQLRRHRRRLPVCWRRPRARHAARQPVAGAPDPGR